MRKAPPSSRSGCDVSLFKQILLNDPPFYRDEGVDVGTDPMWKGQRSFSVDSLFDTSSITSTEDATDYFQSQCNQIFIGMVTMQYQARQVSERLQSDGANI